MSVQWTAIKNLKLWDDTAENILIQLYKMTTNQSTQTWTTPQKFDDNVAIL